MIQTTLDQLIQEAAPLSDDQIDGFLHGLEHTLPSAAAFVRQIIRQKDEEIARLRPSFSEAITRGSIAEGEFGGETFEIKRDEKRLRGQLRKVFQFMRDGKWRSLGDICVFVGCSEQSASARLRDLRKPSFGAYQVDRKRLNGGLFVYRVVLE